MQCIGGSAASGLMEGGVLILAGENTVVASGNISDEYTVLIGIPLDYSFCDSKTQFEEEKENLEKQLEDAQGVIDGLKDSKADIQTKVKELDQQLTSISLEITNTQAQLEEKSAEITDTQSGIRGLTQGGCGKPRQEAMKAKGLA